MKLKWHSGKVYHLSYLCCELCNSRYYISPNPAPQGRVVCCRENCWGLFFVIPACTPAQTFICVGEATAGTGTFKPCLKTPPTKPLPAPRSLGEVVSSHCLRVLRNLGEVGTTGTRYRKLNYIKAHPQTLHLNPLSFLRLSPVIPAQAGTGSRKFSLQYLGSGGKQWDNKGGQIKTPVARCFCLCVVGYLPAMRNTSPQSPTCWPPTVHSNDSKPASTCFFFTTDDVTNAPVVPNTTAAVASDAKRA